MVREGIWSVTEAISLTECEAILAQIIEIKVSQSESMLILELVRGLQTIRSSRLENG